MKEELLKVTKKIGEEVAKNSPTILSGLAVAGVVTTAIFASKATLQAEKVWKKEDLKEKDTMTKVKVLGPVYAPTILMGATTVGCIIGSNTINLRRQAALISAYSASREVVKEFQDKVTDEIGEKKVQKLKDEIAKDRIEKNPPAGDTTIINTGKGETLCYDAYSGRYFKGDIESIRKAQNDLNADILHEMYVTLNDFYDLIGLPPVKLGDQLGWNISSEGPIDIQFSSQLTPKNEPCLVLDYIVGPTFDYGNYH